MKIDDTMEFRRILVIRFHMIGDVLLATPLLEALRRRFPDCYLAMLADRPAADVVQGHPALDDLIIYKCDDERRKTSWADHVRGWNALRRVRQGQFDLVINLHPNQRGEFLTWFSGARHRVGFHRDKMLRGCYSIPVHSRPGSRYRVDYLMDTLRAIGMDVNVGLPSMGLSEEDRRAASSWIPVGSGPLVVLHAGRPNTRKSWVEDRFACVADVLTSRYGARAVFVGAPSEAERVARIVRMMEEPCPSLAGKLTLKQLGALLERADLFVGIDSAPMHIASAVGTATVGFFAFSDPLEWNPPGPEHIAIHKPLPDHPCDPPNCCEPDRSPCMRNISVEDVIEVAEKLLAKRAASQT